jgi:hypothetical protein
LDGFGPGLAAAVPVATVVALLGSGSGGRVVADVSGVPGVAVVEEEAGPLVWTRAVASAGPSPEEQE